MPKKLRYRVEGFTTQDFMDAIEHFPGTVLSERRKQRSYLTSILANNEIDKNDTRNRKLFYRVMRGAYIFNPNLAIKVDNEWINIYELLSIDKLAPYYSTRQDWWLDDYNVLAEKSMTLCKDLLKQMITEKQK